MKWMYLASILALAVVSLLGSAPVVAQEGGEIPTATATVTDEGIEFTSDLSAGLATISVENNRSEGIFSATVARLNDGVTVEEVREAGDEAIFMLTFYGGISVPAGETRSYTVALIAGEYGFFETDGNEDAATFTVADGEPSDVAEPEADVNVALVDFAFGVPGFMPAGPNVWHIDNVGDQWHHMAVFPVDEGTTIADVRLLLGSDDGGPEPAFITEPIGADVEMWTTIDLEPGTYVALCFLPDIAGDFSPHFNHGMVQIFVVE